MRDDADTSTLCYLDASRLQKPSGEPVHVELRDPDHRQIGCLNGVLIDAAERRLRFFVVQSPGWFRPRRYLLTADWPARLGCDGKSLCIDVKPEELARCENFERSSVRAYSDDALIESIFNRRIA